MECCSRLSTRDEFTVDEWSRVENAIERHRGRPGALIPALEEIQGITGYLPESIQRKVAEGLQLPLSMVYGVVTFYSFFTMKPRGKHQIRVCLGTACHVRGAAKNMVHLKRKLGVEVGECTEDRAFGLEAVRCLGACGLAPVVVMDEETHKQVDEKQLDEMLEVCGEETNGSKGWLSDDR